MDIKLWICPNCGYAYEEDLPFELLTTNWTCPICETQKGDFVLE